MLSPGKLVIKCPLVPQDLRSDIAYERFVSEAPIRCDCRSDSDRGEPSFGHGIRRCAFCSAFQQE
jgi:hypothetical protein